MKIKYKSSRKRFVLDQVSLYRKENAKFYFSFEDYGILLFILAILDRYQSGM
jgi:hypothetical protein